MPLSFDPLQDGISKLDFIDSMGGDKRVVDAARVAFSGDMKPWDDIKDPKLIGFLLRNGHWSPFQHTYFTFHVKCPIMVARQWMRHQSWDFNELSRRYTSDDIEVFIPKVFREQSESNRQASGGNVGYWNNIYLRGIFQESVENSLDIYNRLLDYQVAKEQTRGVLPQNLYTRIYGTANLRSLLHFCAERDHKDAQEEIRVFAKAIGECINEVAPITWEKYSELLGNREE